MGLARVVASPARTTINTQPIMTERDFATDCVQRLQAAGHAALFAGGCVRDELLGLTPADYDVATSATPPQVQTLFRRTHQFGASFGVVEVLGPRDDSGEWLKIQVATFRSDGEYRDGRRPDRVTFSTPELDAQRRDFTINGLFFDPVTGGIFDYVGGRADLDAKILRAIGDPAARFREDKLRVVRAARMAARFGLGIDPATRDAAKRFAPEVPVVSGERVAEELRKMLAHPNRVAAVELLHDLGLTASLLPELVDTTGIRQSVLAYLGDAGGPMAALACLTAPGISTRNLGGRLKLANEEHDSLAHFVGNRAAVIAADASPNSVITPLLAKPGARALVAVARAEALGTSSALAGVERCQNLLDSGVTLDPPPLVTGDDLRAAGFEPGPKFKLALARARAAQLDGAIHSPSEALALARSLLG